MPREGASIHASEPIGKAAALVSTVNPNQQQELHDSARLVIGMLTATNWSDADILEYFTHPQPGRDHAYEDTQVAEFGEVRITAAEMRAEIRRLLVN